MSTAVVILNWNGMHHLRKFLPSVVEHTPCDVVVIDNGSTDDSIEMLQLEFPSVKIIALSENFGFAGGYNHGLENLDYEIVVLLNSDVEVTKDWCKPLFEEMKHNPKVGAVAPKLLSYCEPNKFEYAGASGGYIDILGYPFCRGRILQHTESDKGQYDDARELFWVSGAAFCTRLSLFKSLGGFDQDFFAHQEEIDLCWRMQLAGYSIKIIPQSVVYHLGGGTLNASSPRKTMLNHRNNLAMLYKCSSPMQRLLVAVVRPILDMAAAFGYLLKGEPKNFKAVMLAYKDFILWHKELSRKRKQVRELRISESQHIYRGSIILRYIFSDKEFNKLM